MEVTKERRYWSGSVITSLAPNEIFVFGSNPSGTHGAGAAKTALSFGAVPKRGRGLYGQTYALVTKNLYKGYKEYSTGIVYQNDGYRSVTKEQIIENIKALYKTASGSPQLDFIITYQYERYPNGNPRPSLNGYTPDEMIEMFVQAGPVPKNIVFSESYRAKIEPLLARQDNFLASEQDRLMRKNIPNAPDSLKESELQQARSQRGLPPYTQEELNDLLGRKNISDEKVSFSTNVSAPQSVRYNISPSIGSDKPRGFRSKLNLGNTSEQAVFVETQEQIKENLNELDSFGDFGDESSVSSVKEPVAMAPAPSPISQPTQAPVRRGFKPRLKGLGDGGASNIDFPEEQRETAVADVVSETHQVPEVRQEVSSTEEVKPVSNKNDFNDMEFSGWDSANIPGEIVNQAVVTQDDLDGFGSDNTSQVPASFVPPKPVEAAVVAPAPQAPARKGFRPSLKMGEAVVIAETPEELKSNNDSTLDSAAVNVATTSLEKPQVIQEVKPVAPVSGVDDSFAAWAEQVDLEHNNSLNEEANKVNVVEKNIGPLSSIEDVVEMRIEGELPVDLLIEPDFPVEDFVDMRIKAELPVEDVPEVKRSGFSSKLNVSTNSFDNNQVNSEDNADLVRPDNINGVPVLFIDEVYLEEMIPSDFIVDGSFNAGSYVTVNELGSVTAVVQPRVIINGEDTEAVLVEVEEIRKQKEIERQQKALEMLNAPPKKRKTKTTEDAPVVQNKPAVTKEVVKPVVENKEEVTPVVENKVEVTPVAETQKVAEPIIQKAVDVLPAKTPEETKPVVQEVSRVSVTTSFDGYDPYGDADEIPDFLVGLSVTNQQSLVSEVEVETSPIPLVSEQVDVETTEDLVDSIDSDFKDNESNSMQTFSSNYPKREAFVRLKNMTSEQLAKYNLESGENVVITSGVVESVTQEVVETPVVAQVVETPVVAEPVAEEVVETPVVAEPVTEEVVETPVVTEPVAEEVVETPVVSEPVAEEVVETPVVTEPVMEQLPDPRNYTMFFSLYSPFSNFHPAKFEYDGLTFASNEQFMMLSKAQLFNDYAVFDEIMAFNERPLIKKFLNGEISSKQIMENRETASKWNDLQREIKGLGRKVAKFDNEVWKQEREIWVKEGLSQKFVQNEDFKNILLNTNNTKMVEASPSDKIWGIGLNKESALNTFESKWPGLNLLGKLLEEVRHDLKLNLIVSHKNSLDSSSTGNSPSVNAPKAEAPKEAPLYNYDEYHFFYSVYSPFSNFHPSAFQFKNIQFSSVEQFCVYAKAKLFQDEETAQAVLAFNETPFVKEFLDGNISRNRLLKDHQEEWFKLTLDIKKLGSKLPRDNKSWDDRKENVMGVALREKFSQDEDLKSMLLKTKGKEIVETSPKDNYWGVGLSKDEVLKVLPSKWPGHNVLGELLGKLRNKFILEIDPNANLLEPVPKKRKP